MIEGIEDVVGETGEKVNDEPRLEELIQFYNSNKHRLGIGKQNTEMAIENVKRNIWIYCANNCANNQRYSFLA